MSMVKVAAFAVSVDGYGAGANQSLQNPLGERGTTLHAWFYPTRTFRGMIGQAGGDTGVDDEFARRAMENVGAWILGRNMFGPLRGPWTDDAWKGWWGDNPPYHVPTFVLTHHPRPPVVMKGGTTFHFVTGGIHEALQRAREAAHDRDVRIGGGVAIVRQYLQAGLVDEMHLVIAPTLLGAGENLLAGIDLCRLGFACTRHAVTDRAMHVVLSKEAA